MSTTLTCTTPKDGWALYSHFLGNYLLAIQMQKWDRGEESEEQKDKRERVIHDSWTKLAGALYIIMRRMHLNGHVETAYKMEQIVYMVATQDLTDPEVCKAIQAKHKELDKTVGDFETAVDQFNADKTSS